MSEDVLRITDWATAGGQVIKQVVLNAPKSLNALADDMIRQLSALADQWDRDEDIVAIWLEGAGDKAFCAGGDIVQLYRYMTEDGDYQRADDYFRREYALHYQLHTLQTPLITWVDGIAMGGGLGVSVAGSHRVATERARLAMPEIKVGLFPDAGASWFLSRMPGRTGLLAGLTGAHFNAGDAVYAGLADRFVPADQRQAVLEHLAASQDWQQPHAAVSRILRAFAYTHEGAMPASQLAAQRATIDRVLDVDSIPEAVQAVGRDLATSDSDWLAGAAANLATGCPVTACLFWQQLQRARYLSLAACLDMELTIARHCVRNPDFREGVRALLIDKDGHTDWLYKGVAEVPAAYVDSHFQPLAAGEEQGQIG